MSYSVCGLEAILVLELIGPGFGSALLRDEYEDYLLCMDSMGAAQLLSVVQRAKELLQEKGIGLSAPDAETCGSLYINKDYRIFLGSPLGHEIVMRPMAKAVFLLFLKHPEGIDLKRIGTYEEELSGIYRHVSRSDDPELIKRCIRRIVDAGSREVNVAAARSARALAEYISSENLPQYAITGAYGGTKAIRLDRRLVEWE